ncbi:uncharacterized protein LOC100904668 [Galendromus occidentalis]|uniref:Uncharacterized protein LOC100904668 n=1 Tax=Galendromus occidentalis TaxID=34638 RepID=A0AAJ6VZ46_9ACAR|nr:uncharacterized protein LOC100904668 [Galendromus occidentalis]
MYTIKGPNGGLLKTRLMGINGNKNTSFDVSAKSISPPNEKTGADSVNKSPCHDGLPIGPRPVFLPPKNGANSHRRKPRPDKTPDQEVCRVQPDAEVVSFFAMTWNSLQTSPETEKKSTSKSNDIVYYRPHNAVKVPEFTPCNYERVWADHHYHKIIRHVIQNQTP